MPRDILVLGFPITRHKELIKTNKHLIYSSRDTYRQDPLKEKKKKSAFQNHIYECFVFAKYVLV